MVDFQFFEELSSAEAKAYLGRYLEVVAQGWAELAVEAASEGVDVRPRFESIVPVLSWVRRRLIEAGGLAAVDSQASKVLILRASYFLGECFATEVSHLKWAVGAPGVAIQNQPVVTGFKYEMELAPMLVCENLLRHGLRNPSDLTRFETAVAYWRRFL